MIFQQEYFDLGTGNHFRNMGVGAQIVGGGSCELWVYIHQLTAQTVKVRLVDQAGNEIAPQVTAEPGQWQSSDQVPQPGLHQHIIAEIVVEGSNTPGPMGGPSSELASVVVGFRAG